MCGRYEIQISEKDLADIIAEVQRKFPGEKLHTGDICPTDKAPVLLAKDGNISPEIAKWGYPQYGGKKGVIINARAETVEEKQTFRDSFLSQRCIIPSTGYFEWTKTAPKQKYLFKIPDAGMIYLGGLYRQYGNETCFVILTTTANSSVEEIHQRMPVVLQPEQISPWLLDVDAARQIKSSTMPILKRTICA